MPEKVKKHPLKSSPNRDYKNRVFEFKADSVGLKIDDILNAFPFYVMLIDEEHRILQVNKAVQGQLGLEPEAIIGQYCPTIIHGQDKPWYACPLEEAVDKKGIAVEREAFDEKSGRWMRSVVYPTRRLTGDGKRIFFHMVSDVTDRKQAEEQLKTSRQQLRNLSAHLEAIREEERRKMAREVHDELGQILTSLKIDLSWLTRKLATENETLVEKVKYINALVDEAIQTGKRISAELRPGVLDDLGLVAAIEWQTEELEKRSEMKFKFKSFPDDFILDTERSVAIFRICQEALTNILRHSGATKVNVNLKKEENRIVLRVRDNGKGIEKKHISDPKAFGLIGMRERARIWGGEVHIRGTPGKGTTVVASIPLAIGDNKDAENIDCR